MVMVNIFSTQKNAMIYLLHVFHIKSLYYHRWNIDLQFRVLFKVEGNIVMCQINGGTDLY